MNSNSYSYDNAYIRNRGLVDENQQRTLCESLVAIAGLGGMGGGHAICLARMGFSQFHLADFDNYELSNFNRQLGATIHSIGKNKAETIADQIKEINPDAKIVIFNKGLQPENIDHFLSSASIVIDAIDFFQMKIRSQLYLEAHKKQIPVLFTAPLGFSSTFIAFSPQGCSFSDYFKITPETSYFDSLVKFAAGIAPKGLHWPYFDVPTDDILNKRGPSVALSCFLGNSILGMQALNFVLWPKNAVIAPYSLQLDLRRQLYAKAHLPFGNGSLTQRVKQYLIARKFIPYKERIEKSQLISA